MPETEIDFGKLDYEEWIEVVFNRTNGCVPWIQSEFAYPSRRPVALIKHLTKLCIEFSTLKPKFSPEQIDKGVWSILMFPIGAADQLVRKNMPLKRTITCIKSMYWVFADSVTKMEEKNPTVTSYFMWWDIIAHEFCVQHDHNTRDIFRPTDERTELIHDTIFETLVLILSLDDSECQLSALHGIGHLHHARGAEVIQQFIGNYGKNFSEEQLEWMVRCQTGYIR